MVVEWNEDCEIVHIKILNTIESLDFDRGFLILKFIDLIIVLRFNKIYKKKFRIASEFLFSWV